MPPARPRHGWNNIDMKLENSARVWLDASTSAGSWKHVTGHQKTKKKKNFFDFQAGHLFDDVTPSSKLKVQKTLLYSL
jgi:hypothetical protein